MNKQEIVEWLKKYSQSVSIHHTINDDLTVDVDNDIFLDFENLTILPFKFNIVNGYFSCSNNKLTTLKNCPNIVKGHFGCFNNNLTSLEHCPKIIQGDFWCDPPLNECKEYKVYQMMKILRK